jgi:hypothetical protein
VVLLSLSAPRSIESISALHDADLSQLTLVFVHLCLSLFESTLKLRECNDSTVPAPVKIFYNLAIP